MIVDQRSRDCHEVWLQVENEADVPRQDPARGMLVPTALYVCYRRDPGRPSWYVESVKVAGLPRLTGGGVGDNHKRETVLHPYRLGRNRLPDMPPWVRNYVQEKLPT